MRVVLVTIAPLLSRCSNAIPDSDERFLDGNRPAILGRFAASPQIATEPDERASCPAVDESACNEIRGETLPDAAEVEPGPRRKPHPRCFGIALDKCESRRATPRRHRCRHR
jgi:hypothetical protein